MRDDALPLRRVALAGGAIVLLLAGAVTAVLLGLRAVGLPPGGPAVARPTPPTTESPALQTAPQLELAAYRREKARELDTLAWVDAGRTTARVPVEAATALQLARAASAAASRAAPAPVLP